MDSMAQARAVEARPLRSAGRPVSIISMRFSRLHPIFAGLVLVLTGRSAQAAPIQGVGEATATEKSARDKALKGAREDAFGAAIERIEHSVDRKALKAAQANLAVWTSSYRVVERVSDGDTLRMRVEFEIDLPRLAKRLAPQTTPVRRGFELGPSVVGDECPSNLAGGSELREALFRAGVPVFEGGEALELTFDCKGLGRVPATFVHAARVVLTAQLAGGRTLRMEAVAFGEDLDHAMRAGRDQSLDRVGAQLEGASSGATMIRVHGVSDGSRVRRLVVAIREGVVGVDSVRVAAVEAGGIVQLELENSLSAEQLSVRLEALEFPDFNFALLAPPPNPVEGAAAGPDLTASLLIDLEIL